MIIADVAAQMFAYLEENQGECVWMCVWADDTCGDSAAGGDALGTHICQEDHQTCRREKNAAFSFMF